MPRIARGLADNMIYHIINRGNGKQEVFHKDKDYEAFIKLLQEAKKRFPVKLYGYCLMPNHFHLIVRPELGRNLSRLMQWVMTSHVRRYHRHYGGSGHIWQGRYKSFMIQEDVHLLMTIRYTEGNPVRASLSRTARDWKWSSHNETIGERNKKIIDKIPIELPKRWSQYVDTPMIEKELEKLRKSVQRQTPYGKSEWQMEMCEKFGLASTIRQIGRPKKESEL